MYMYVYIYIYMPSRSGARRSFPHSQLLILVRAGRGGEDPKGGCAFY